MKICVIGNCQYIGLADCMRVMLPDAEVVGIYAVNPPPPPKDCDLIFLHLGFSNLREDENYWDGVPPSAIKLIPPFTYSAFHPDLIYAWNDNAALQSALGDYNSALILYGWMNGLSPGETVRLFCDPVYQHLNYHEYGAASRQHLFDLGDQCGFDLRPLLEEWSTQGCFAHSINHPKLFVLSGIARTALTKYGVKIAVNRPEDYLQDALVRDAVWPVYPEIAARLGVAGSYQFKVPEHPCAPGRPVEILDLEQFVERSFARYAQHPKDSLKIPRLADQRELYRNLESLVPRPRRKRANPYSNLPDYCFWQRSVANVAPPDLDPVVKPKFCLARSDRISTAGSCFAQNIAKTLIAADYNYFVAEPPPADMPAEAAAARGYGLFSARFGNIYSARQLLQLFQRAYGEFAPNDIAWRRDDGRFVDPFRPQIEPDGFPSTDAVVAAREGHLAAVRRMFEQSALFVFTVGLTEAWAAKSDGAVFPVAPGVVSGSLNQDDYCFVNFRVADIVAELNAFIEKLRSVNRHIRLLFTVSPVPLVATYENRHVLVSTTYSKSAIRAAVEEVVQQYDFVDYFPSYEIITGWYNKGQYFDRDLRSVTPDGVGHVMRLFSAHYLQPAPLSADDVTSDAAGRHAAALKQEIAQVAKIICDEELLDRRRTGAAPRLPEVPRPAASVPGSAAFTAGSGGSEAPRAAGAPALPFPDDPQNGLLTAQLHEMRAQVSALQEALAQEIATREDQVRHLTEQAAGQSEEAARLRTTADNAGSRHEALQAEIDGLRERLDQMTHGIETWLMPTLEKHAAAIERRRRPLRQFGRRAARLIGLF